MNIVKKLRFLVKQAFMPAAADPNVRFDQPCRHYNPDQD